MNWETGTYFCPGRSNIKYWEHEHKGYTVRITRFKRNLIWFDLIVGVGAMADTLETLVFHSVKEAKVYAESKAKEWGWVA